MRNKLNSALLGAAVATTIGLASVSGNAFASEGSYTNFDGFNVGANVGYEIGEARSLSRDNDVGLDGFGGGASVAYGTTALYPRVYTGLEGSYSLSDASGKTTVAPETSVRVRREHSFAADTKIGYVADQDTLLYGKVGYERTGFKLNGDRDWRDGVRLGGGIEHFVYDDSVTVKAEYVHTHTLPNKGRDTFRNAINSELKIGVAYHF